MQQALPIETRTNGALQRGKSADVVQPFLLTKEAAAHTQPRDRMTDATKLAVGPSILRVKSGRGRVKFLRNFAVDQVCHRGHEHNGLSRSQSVPCNEGEQTKHSVQRIGANGVTSPVPVRQTKSSD